MLVFCLSAMALNTMLAYWYGKTSTQIGCDHWCEQRSGYYTADDYLACKLACHGFDEAHLECVIRALPDGWQIGGEAQ